MPRRTVTIAEGVDAAIRSFQARLMRVLNEDVTYTEATNLVLLIGLVRQPSAIWKDDTPAIGLADLLQLMVGLKELGREGLLDMLPEEIRAAASEQKKLQEST